jgi:hypothetical protein
MACHRENGIYTESRDDRHQHEMLENRGCVTSHIEGAMVSGDNPNPTSEFPPARLWGSLLRETFHASFFEIEIS